MLNRRWHFAGLLRLQLSTVDGMRRLLTSLSRRTHAALLFLTSQLIKSHRQNISFQRAMNSSESHSSPSFSSLFPYFKAESVSLDSISSTWIHLFALRSKEIIECIHPVHLASQLPGPFSLLITSSAVLKQSIVPRVFHIDITEAIVCVPHKDIWRDHQRFIESRWSYEVLFKSHTSKLGTSALHEARAEMTDDKPRMGVLLFGDGFSYFLVWSTSSTLR